MHIAALIPSYNNAETIGPTVAALLSLQEVDLVLVVDDGSRDGTAGQAAKAGAEVIVHPLNRGKGAALNTGFEALRRRNVDAVALADGDLGTSASSFAALIQPVRENLADMTIARFPKPRGKGGFGLAKGFCRAGLFLFTGRRFESPMSGQRVVVSGILFRLAGFAPGWGCEAALTIDVHRLGGRIMEVPVEMAHEETGRTLAGFLHRGRQMMAAASIFAGRALSRRQRGGG